MQWQEFPFPRIENKKKEKKALHSKNLSSYSIDVDVEVFFLQHGGDVQGDPGPMLT